jgi:S-phase kinase-associated protein 1
MVLIQIQIGDQVINVEKEIVDQSIFLKNMLEDLGESDVPISIPDHNVDFVTFNRIVDYFKNRPKDYKTEVVDRDDAWTKMNEYDKTFIGAFEVKDLTSITLACNFLDIKHLLEISCIRFAHLIKISSVEEIKKIFNLPDDLEEEKKTNVLDEID